jgi:PAS domain S-box-containing protein
MSNDKSYCKFMTADDGSDSAASCLTAEKFCSIIENTDDAIITMSVNGKITGWNAGAERIYQYTADEILGTQYPLVPAEKKSEFSQVITQMKSGERIPDYETQRIRKDGKLLDVSIAFFPIKDKLGRINEFCSIHRDITERKRLQSEMMRARELAAIGQLAAGVAHALNTPLASILMSSQMLREDLITNSSKDDLDRIERQTERCKIIVRNLLNLSRPGGMVRESTDLNKLIKTVIHNIEPAFKKKMIQLVFNLDETLPKVSCDPQTIEEMISNLITNAHDAIHSTGTITIHTQPEGNNIVLKIQDTGKGIQPEHLSHVYDPFFTTKEIGKGTGLGLALCARIVHDHNGTIRVESQPGMGTTFTIHLPITRVESHVSAGVS